MVTTSWPSQRRRWAGHFILSLASELAKRGHDVHVVAPSWKHDGALLEAPRVSLHPMATGLSPGALSRRSLSVLLALATLRKAVLEVHQQVRPDLWCCHWWPTLWTTPGGTARVAVLHGSDMELLERFPWLLSSMRRVPVVAVSRGLADRYERLFSREVDHICHLGAYDTASSPTAPRGELPAQIGNWSLSERPRLLTVGRNTVGKGIHNAREVAAAMPEVDWLMITPDRGWGPEWVRYAIERATLVVLPTLGGSGYPKEGRPHLIAQALTAGVPLVGGPNHAVRQVLREAGQFEVRDSGASALQSAVAEALAPATYRKLEAAAEEARSFHHWRGVLPAWEQALQAGELHT
jgi:glycosyltransferase involved in cell wall biosynthesis